MKKLLFAFFLQVATISFLYGQKLIVAVEASNYELVEQYIKAGEKVNKAAKNGHFPLWNAVWNGDTKMVSLLLQNGANAKQKFKGKQEDTGLLEIASQEGHLEICQLLVNGGADAHEKGHGGHTPLRIAARNGRLELVKYFISLNAEIDTKGDDGATPLEHAATKGHLEIVTLLIEHGADINIQDKDGDFPIGEAVKYGHIETVKYLLSKGADLSLLNKKGYSAIDLAKLHGQPKLEELLKGAKSL